MLEQLKKQLATREPGKGQLITLKAGAVRVLLKDATGEPAAGLLAAVDGLPDYAEVYQQADAWFEVSKDLK